MDDTIEVAASDAGETKQKEIADFTRLCENVWRELAEENVTALENFELVEISDDEAHAICKAAFHRVMREQNRYLGTSDIRECVHITDGKPCRSKRHFTGCLRQVIGLAEKLAANDPERFIFIKQGFIKNARKGRKGEYAYSERQVFYALDLAEKLSILIPAERNRNGLKSGFIVADHDAVTETDGKNCTLTVRPLASIPRYGKQKRRAYSEDQVETARLLAAFTDQDLGELKERAFAVIGRGEPATFGDVVRQVKATRSHGAPVEERTLSGPCSTPERPVFDPVVLANQQNPAKNSGVPPAKLQPTLNLGSTYVEKTQENPHNLKQIKGLANREPIGSHNAQLHENTLSIASPIASETDPNCMTNCMTDAQKLHDKLHDEIGASSRDSIEYGESLRQNQRRFGGANPVNPVKENPVNPVKENPAEKQSAPAPLSAKADRDSRAGCDHDERTIGDVLGHLSDGNTAITNMLPQLSDGLFDVQRLASYAHRFELALCCGEAIRDLAGMPYCRKSLADVMGRGMELLKSRYGANAPRGWVPVMKQLRKRPTEPEFTQPESVEPKSVAASEAKRPDADDYGPRGILVNWGSGVNAIDPEAAEALDAQPEVKAAFVGLAERIGVPRCYAAALKFMHELKIENPPAEVTRIREKLEEWAKGQPELAAKAS